MSKIVKLDDTYDLWLTYSWSSTNHGICGHVYEVIDYYFILRNQFKVGVLFCEDISWSTIELAIRSKYNFTDDEIADLRANTLFHNRPRLLVGTNILFTDGGVINTSSVIMSFDNIIYFACGNKTVSQNTDPRTWILQDNRVYAPVLVNGIDYKKRILFDRLKTISSYDDNLLVYTTANCREFTNFSGLSTYNNILAVVNTIPRERFDNIEFVVPPVTDIFSRFSTYLYTPVPRKFDCSPRFIAECKHYGRDVVYHNIDYWDVDTGLYWRKWDIDNDFDSLRLTPADPIIPIIGNIIQGENSAIH